MSSRYRQGKRGPRAGLTYIEVTVVVSLITLLAAISFPVALKYRETSRKLHCQQNLKQLGLALHTYHDAFGSFPTAADWSTARMRSVALDMSTRPDLFIHSNWAIKLLPYVDQAALANQLDEKQPIAASCHNGLRNTPLSLMSCPADNYNQPQNLHRFEPVDGRPITFARGNYALNGGTHNMRPEPGTTSFPTGDGVVVIANENTREFQYWGNGLAGFNKAFQLQDFQNGSSTFVALEEVRAGIHPVDPRGVWAFGQISSSITWAHGVNGDDYGPNNSRARSDDILGCAKLHDAVGSETLINENMPCVSYLDNNTNATARSQHHGGVNVLFLDGTARFISEQIDPGLWHVIHSRDTPKAVFEGMPIEKRLEVENFAEHVSGTLPVPASESSRDSNAEMRNSLDMVFQRIPAGQFLMGVPDDGNQHGLPEESPPHKVQISCSYLLGRFEVTQQQYEDVMGINPSYHTQDRTALVETRQFPVESVSWLDATEFCRRLSALPAEQEAGRRYRLPTEAEWEYACRAGSDKRYHWRPQRSARDDSGETGGINPSLPLQPVGSYRGNAFGLYDMRGNVWEWCHDWFDRDYYARSPKNDPTGPGDGYIKVVRGSDWRYVGEGCKIDYAMLPPWKSNRFIGFRVVSEIAP